MSKKKEKAGTAVTTNTKPDQPDGNSRHEPTLDEVVAFCQQHGLVGSVVGKWVWVFFDEKPDEATRKLQKLDFNNSAPDCYGEACKNAIEEILTGGPNFFSKNRITPPRSRRSKNYSLKTKH